MGITSAARSVERVRWWWPVGVTDGLEYPGMRPHADSRGRGLGVLEHQRVAQRPPGVQHRVCVLDIRHEVGSFSPQILGCRTPGSGRTPGARYQLLTKAVSLDPLQIET